MSSKRKIAWADVDGSFEKKRRLHLVEAEDKTFLCPVSHCEHASFSSKRGCRKHVSKHHGWYYYFDEPPQVTIEPSKDVKQTPGLNVTTKSVTMKVPGMLANNAFANEFLDWMSSPAGGGRGKNHAEQIVSRILKFFAFCLEDMGSEEELESNYVDYCIGSVEHIRKFLENMETAHKITNSGQLGYIRAILELIDYRKFQGLPANILQHFSVVEIYLRRIRKGFSKKMRVQWSTSLDIETLEKKGHWATMKELQKVIPFHVEKFNDILSRCKQSPKDVTPTELTFATRFVAAFLFLRVKGTRPMSYQFLTLEMIEYASKKDSFIDQRKFKTADRYIFDSFRLDKTSLYVIKSYKCHIRPLLNPSCDFLLVNRNGTQFTKLTEALGKLVFEAIGKYINPTRYRQIIETESCSYLDSEEQEWISEDQKHSSNVARISYKKKRSREIAIRGRNCVRKLQGEEGEKVEKQLATLFTEDETATDESEHDDIFITQISPMNDDQFNSQNTCSDVKESCRDNSVIQNSHLPYTTSETEKNCSENEQSLEEIFNKKRPPRTEIFPKGKTVYILQCIILFQVTMQKCTVLDYNFKLIIDQVKSNRLHLKKMKN